MIENMVHSRSLITFQNRVTVDKMNDVLQNTQL